MISKPTIFLLPFSVVAVLLLTGATLESPKAGATQKNAPMLKVSATMITPLPDSGPPPLPDSSLVVVVPPMPTNLLTITRFTNYVAIELSQEGVFCIESSTNLVTWTECAEWDTQVYGKTMLVMDNGYRFFRAR